MSIDTSVGRVEGVRVSIETSVQVSGQGSGRGVGQGIVVTVANGSVVRRPLELNASSNASVGKLRKHLCSALGAGKP